MKKKCTQCGSEDLLEGLRVADRGENNYRRPLEIEMDTKPDAIFFRGTASTPVTASMCCICGHVMLFAEPSFASNLKQACTLRTKAGELGDPKKHPLFKEFLKADPANKHLDSMDQVNAFAYWLSQQDRG